MNREPTREYYSGGAREPERGQSHWSRKDQCRSPSGRHQQRDTNYGPGGHQEYDRSRHQRQFRGRDRSSSRGRGEFRPYRDQRDGDRDRDRDRDRERHTGFPYDRRRREAMSYDDEQDDPVYQRDYSSGYYSRGRDRRHEGGSPSRDYSPSRDFRGSYGSFSGRRRDDHSYGRSRSHSPHGPGQPSETVIVEAIPQEMEDHDLNFGLNALQLAGLQEIRIRRDKHSGRRIAFLEFSHVQNAMDFVESYPELSVALQLPHNAPTGVNRVRISYSWTKRPEGRDDWRCDSCRSRNHSSHRDCYKCGAMKTQQDSTDAEDVPVLTGEKDACPNQKPYPIVVVTGLESSTGEEVFAKGVTKLYIENEQAISLPVGPSGLKTTAPVGNTKGLGARPSSLRRVFIVRDRKSRASWKYGFAEFATTEDAAKAIAKFQATPRFTIASKPVEVAFIHTGVFVPVLPPEPQVAPFVFPALHNPDIRLRYWDYRAYANPHVVSTDPLVDAPTTSTERKEISEKKEKKRKAEKELGGLKKKAIAMAPQMQMWANKSAEIRGQSPNDTAPSELRPTDTVNGPKTLDAPVAGFASAPSKPEPVWSYADPKRMCCLLCQRKFKSMELVRKHEMESAMHKDNLGDQLKKESATKAMAALGLEPHTVETGPQYRDRAKERRAAHNQPKKPPQAPKKDGDSAEQKKAPEAPPAAPAPPKMLKGMAILSKMGLKSGEGLGADGSGRTEIISTDLYRPGVGLGAAGAKVGDAAEEGARATRNDFDDFINKTKEKARERFESLNKS